MHSCFAATFNRLLVNSRAQQKWKYHLDILLCTRNTARTVAGSQGSNTLKQLPAARRPSSSPSAGSVPPEPPTALQASSIFKASFALEEAYLEAHKQVYSKGRLIAANLVTPSLRVVAPESLRISGPAQLLELVQEAVAQHLFGPQQIANTADATTIVNPAAEETSPTQQRYAQLWIRFENAGIEFLENSTPFQIVLFLQCCFVASYNCNGYLSHLSRVICEGNRRREVFNRAIWNSSWSILGLKQRGTIAATGVKNVTRARRNSVTAAPLCRTEVGLPSQQQQEQHLQGAEQRVVGCTKVSANALPATFKAPATLSGNSSSNYLVPPMEISLKCAAREMSRNFRVAATPHVSTLRVIGLLLKAISKHTPHTGASCNSGGQRLGLQQHQLFTGLLDRLLCSASSLIRRGNSCVSFSDVLNFMTAILTISTAHSNRTQQSLDRSKAPSIAPCLMGGGVPPSRHHTHRTLVDATSRSEPDFAARQRDPAGVDPTLLRNLVLDLSRILTDLIRRQFCNSGDVEAANPNGPGNLATTAMCLAVKALSGRFMDWRADCMGTNAKIVHLSSDGTRYPDDDSDAPARAASRVVCGDLLKLTVQVLLPTRLATFVTAIEIVRLLTALKQGVQLTAAVVTVQDSWLRELFLLAVPVERTWPSQSFRQRPLSMFAAHLRCPPYLGSLDPREADCSTKLSLLEALMQELTRQCGSLSAIELRSACKCLDFLVERLPFELAVECSDVENLGPAARGTWLDWPCTRGLKTYMSSRNIPSSQGAETQDKLESSSDQLIRSPTHAIPELDP